MPSRPEGKLNLEAKQQTDSCPSRLHLLQQQQLRLSHTFFPYSSTACCRTCLLSLMTYLHAARGAMLLKIHVRELTSHVHAYPKVSTIACLAHLWKLDSGRRQTMSIVSLASFCGRR